MATETAEKKIGLSEFVEGFLSKCIISNDLSGISKVFWNMSDHKYPKKTKKQKCYTADYKFKVAKKADEIANWETAWQF